MSKKTWITAFAGPLALALSLVTTGSTIAYAKDFCIDGTSAPFQLVGKNFKVPAHGKCKPFAGFFSSDNRVGTSGQACTADDNSHVTFVLTTVENSGFIEIDNIDLSLPSLTGTLNGNSTSGTTWGGFGSQPVTAAPCPADVPVP
jgi:hypothetical protein